MCKNCFVNFYLKVILNCGKNIKFIIVTILECTPQGSFTLLCSGPPEHFCIAKLKLWTASPSLLSPTPGSHHATLSLWVCLLCVSAIKEYLSLCDWLVSRTVMPSRFIHAVAGHRISFLNNITLCVFTTFCLCIHLLLNTWVTSTRSYFL